MTFSTIGIALLLGMQLFQVIDKIIDKLSSSECTNKGMRVEMKHKLEQELAPHESVEKSTTESSRPRKRRIQVSSRSQENSSGSNWEEENSYDTEEDTDELKTI